MNSLYIFALILFILTLALAGSVIFNNMRKGK